MIAYIWKSSLSLIFLFGLYWFLLRKEKLFVFNRYFLVLSVVFSLILPLISIPVNFRVLTEIHEILPAYDYQSPEIYTSEASFSQNIYSGQQIVMNQPSDVDISKILIVLYLVAAILLFIRFLRNMYLILNRIKVSEKISLDGYRIILTDENTNPYCFLNHIFLSRIDYKAGRIGKELLKHEMEHASQSHTLDIIFIELVKIFYWFNPVNFLYEKAIRINHEYLADNGVISTDHDIKDYADILIRYITGMKNIPLTSGSNHSLTRKRLIMMTKTSSGYFGSGARISAALISGLLLFLLMSFKESIDHSLKSELKYEPEEYQSIVKGIVLTEDGKPLYNAFVIAARDNNIPFRVGTGFDGHFRIYDLKEGTLLTVECGGFKGQTVKADFSNEMVIRLAKDPDYKGKIIMPEIRDVSFMNPDFSPAKSIVVLNGSVLDYDKSLTMDPALIKSFRIMNDNEAVIRYGERAKDGVLEIVLHEKGGKMSDVRQTSGSDSDTAKYKTRININTVSNNGEIINIPVKNLRKVEMWTYKDMNQTGDKESRYIVIMTRDFYQVRGKVTRANGRPLSGVKISSTDNPSRATSNRKGIFKIEDVRENSILEFSRSGYEPYYLATKFSVPYTMDMTIKLNRAKRSGDE